MLWRFGFMLCIGLLSRLAFVGAGLHAEWLILGHLQPLLCSSRFGLLGYTPALLYVFIDFRLKTLPCMHVLVLRPFSSLHRRRKSHRMEQGGTGKGDETRCCLDK